MNKGIITNPLFLIIIVGIIFVGVEAQPVSVVPSSLTDSSTSSTNLNKDYYKKGLWIEVDDNKDLTFNLELFYVKAEDKTYYSFSYNNVEVYELTKECSECYDFPYIQEYTSFISLLSYLKTQYSPGDYGSFCNYLNNNKLVFFLKGDKEVKIEGADKCKQFFVAAENVLFPKEIKPEIKETKQTETTKGAASGQSVVQALATKTTADTLAKTPTPTITSLSNIDEVWLKLKSVLGISLGAGEEIWDASKEIWVSAKASAVTTVTPAAATASTTTAEVQAGTLTVSESEAVSAKKLYNDLLIKGILSNLAKGMVVNAEAESRINKYQNGDCGNKYNSPPSILIAGKGKCCSFGLWQLNICSGLGKIYLKDKNLESSSDKDKLSALYNYDLQVDFMADYLKSKYSSTIINEKTMDEWVDWFARYIEKPANLEIRIKERKVIAKQLEEKGAFATTTSTTSSDVFYETS